MKTVSLELCKKLYELSGWVDTQKDWYDIDGTSTVHCGHEFMIGKELVKFRNMVYICPAYDTDYLLDKLPYKIESELPYDIFLLIGKLADGDCDVYYSYDCEAYPRGDIGLHTGKLPDALAKLAIALFEQGHLKKKES